MINWLDSANNDLGAAEQLFSSARYDWCLFIGHLVTEKTFKAFFVYKNDSKIPPKTHSLLKLAQASDLPLTEDQEIFLDEVNDFILEVRSPNTAASSTSSALGNSQGAISPESRILSRG